MLPGETDLTLDHQTISINLQMDTNVNIQSAYAKTKQGSKGMRQWPINWCASPIIIHKITHSVVYNHWLNRVIGWTMNCHAKFLEFYPPFSSLITHILTESTRKNDPRWYLFKMDHDIILNFFYLSAETLYQLLLCHSFYCCSATTLQARGTSVTHQQAA